MLKVHVPVPQIRKEKADLKLYAFKLEKRLNSVSNYIHFCNIYLQFIASDAKYLFTVKVKSYLECIVLKPKISQCLIIS